MPPDYPTALANHPFRLAQPNGTTIFASPHSILLATNLTSENLKGHTFTLNDYVQGGTPSQRNALLNETMRYMESLNTSNPEVELDIWYDFGDKKICAVEDARGKYEVRQSDGTFRAETLDEVVGQLISGKYGRLQVRGSIEERRGFFEAIRRRIAGVEVVVGRDVKRAGVVEFEDSEEETFGLEDRIEWLQKEFEDMVLDIMETVEEEEILVEGVRELVVEEDVDVNADVHWF